MASWTHWWAVAQGLSEDIDLSLEQATRLARKAMALDDFTGLSHLVMAEVDLFHREHDKALAAVEDAVLARPSCDLSFVAKANILIYLGRAKEAIDLVKYAIRLAPVSPPFFQATLAAAYYGSGEYPEAIAAAQEAITSDQNNLDALLVLAGANAALGLSEQAKEAVSAIKALKPDFTLATYAETQRYKDPQTLKKVIAMLRKAGLD